jgi:hypothetical protein
MRGDTLTENVSIELSVMSADLLADILPALLDVARAPASEAALLELQSALSHELAKPGAPQDDPKNWPLATFSVKPGARALVLYFADDEAAEAMVAATKAVFGDLMTGHKIR